MSLPLSNPSFVGLRNDGAWGQPATPPPPTTPTPTVDPSTLTEADFQPDTPTPTAVPKTDISEWDNPKANQEYYQSRIDNITQKYTDPNNPNPNISDDDKKALTGAYQQLALQSTPAERTGKMLKSAGSAAGDWVKSHPLVATGAALGGPLGAGIGLVASPGFWNDAGNVWNGIKKTFVPSPDETIPEMGSGAALGLWKGIANAGLGLGTDIRGAYQLGISPFVNHTNQAMNQGALDADLKAKQIYMDATTNDYLNTVFSKSGGAYSAENPAPAALATPQVQAGETVGGIIPYALGGMALEKTGLGMATRDILNATANKAVDLGNVVAGKTLQGVGNLINHPVITNTVNTLNNPLVRAGVGAGLGMSTGGIPGAIIDAAIGGGATGPLAARITAAINAGLDSTADAVTTQGTILANSAGQGTRASASQVLQDKIGMLNSTIEDIKNPLSNTDYDQDAISSAQAKRDMYQGMLDKLGAAPTNGGVDDGWVTNALKNMAYQGGATLSGATGAALLGGGQLMPGQEDSIKQMVDAGMSMGAIGGILKGRLDRTAAMASDLEAKGQAFKRSDANLSKIHDDAYNSLPPNLQAEVDRWQGALGRGVEIYVLPHDQFVNPSIGGGQNGIGAHFQKIAGEPRRIIIDADSSANPQGFIQNLQGAGGLAMDDVLKTQSPQIRNALINSMKPSYTSQEVKAFQDNYVAGYPGGKFNLEQDAKNAGTTLDDHMRSLMAAQHYQALMQGTSLQSLFTDPNILQKTASNVVDVLKNSPLKGVVESFQKVFGKVPDGEGGTIKTPWGDLPVANNGIDLARKGFQSFYNDTRRVNNPGKRTPGTIGKPQPVDLNAIAAGPLPAQGPGPASAPFVDLNNPQEVQPKPEQDINGNVVQTAQDLERQAQQRQSDQQKLNDQNMLSLHDGSNGYGGVPHGTYSDAVDRIRVRNQAPGLFPEDPNDANIVNQYEDSKNRFLHLHPLQSGVDGFGGVTHQNYQDALTRQKILKANPGVFPANPSDENVINNYEAGRKQISPTQVPLSQAEQTNLKSGKNVNGTNRVPPVAQPPVEPDLGAVTAGEAPAKAPIKVDPNHTPEKINSRRLSVLLEETPNTVKIKYKKAGNINGWTLADIAKENGIVLSSESTPSSVLQDLADIEENRNKSVEQGQKTDPLVRGMKGDDITHPDLGAVTPNKTIPPIVEGAPPEPGSETAIGSPEAKSPPIAPIEQPGTNPGRPDLTKVGASGGSVPPIINPNRLPDVNNPHHVAGIAGLSPVQQAVQNQMEDAVKNGGQMVTFDNNAAKSLTKRTDAQARKVEQALSPAKNRKVITPDTTHFSPTSFNINQEDNTPIWHGNFIDKFVNNINQMEMSPGAEQYKDLYPQWARDPNLAKDTITYNLNPDDPSLSEEKKNFIGTALGYYGAPRTGSLAKGLGISKNKIHSVSGTIRMKNVLGAPKGKSNSINLERNEETPNEPTDDEKAIENLSRSFPYKPVAQQNAQEEPEQIGRPDLSEVTA